MSDSPPPDAPVSHFNDTIGLLLREGHLLPPQTAGTRGRLAQFEILSQLGAGGMGCVLKARDSRTGGIVALKLLRPELRQHPRGVHRFLVEARHLQRLRHPNLVPVLEVSSAEDSPWFAMPCFERSLGTLLRPGQPLEQDRVLAIARQMSAVLQHIHARGIIHRDLKPANILIATDGSAHLADFGLAQTLFNDSVLDVQRERFEGTAAYVSPQVARGEAEDTRCDIYSFGALLYEMLTGHLPYEGQTPKEVLQKILASQPRPILARNPKASPTLASIARACMAHEHRDRYANMADVEADLERTSQGQPPLGPHGQWRDWGRWPSLWRGWVASPRLTLGVMIRIGVVLLLGITGASVWRWSQPKLTVVRRILRPSNPDWAEAQVGHWFNRTSLDFYLRKDRSDPRRTELLVVSGDGQDSAAIPTLEPRTSGLSVIHVQDINGDGLDEAFLSWANGTNSQLVVMNQNRAPIRRFSLAGTESPYRPKGSTLTETSYTGMVATRLTDLDGDGSFELLAAVETGWGLNPRGIACFDPTNSSPLWSFHIAPVPTTFVTFDRDGNGEAEIVLGSNAVDNNNRLADGTDDAHCYVYALSHRGKLLWRRELDSPYCQSYPFISRSNPTAKPRLYVWLRANAWVRASVGAKEVGRIVELDSLGATTKDYDAGAAIVSCQLADLDGDGTQEILATDRAGFLHELDANLKVRRKVQVVRQKFDSVELVLIGVTNLTHNSANEIVLLSSQEARHSPTNIGNEQESVNVQSFHDNVVLVLDSALRLKARFVVHDRWLQQPKFSARIADMDGDGLSEVVVLAAEAIILRYRRGW